jgi:hypothetical protein
MKRDQLNLSLRDLTGGDQAVLQPYASGMSGLRDLRAALGSAIAVGVEIGKLSGNGMLAIAAALASPDPKMVFVDSGAFNAFRRARRKGDMRLARLDFDRILGRYEDLSLRVLAAAGDPQFVAFVAPDIVGDQAGTLALLELHAARILDLTDRGHELIVPFQRGPLPVWDVYLRVREILEEQPFTVGIPSAVEALGNDELRRFLTRPYRPDRLHILGAISSRRAEERLTVIRECYVGDVPGVTADAMVMRARLHELRGLAGEEKVQAIQRILNRVAPRAALRTGCVPSSENERIARVGDEFGPPHYPLAPSTIAS